MCLHSCQTNVDLEETKSRGKRRQLDYRMILVRNKTRQKVVKEEKREIYLKRKMMKTRRIGNQNENFWGDDEKI